MTNIPESVMGLPRPVATPTGAIMVLGDGGDLVNDLQRALVAGAVRELPEYERLKALIAREQEARGLRDEAGYATGPFLTGLRTHTERLATGNRLGCFLMFGRTRYGDAIWWNVAIMDQSYEAVSFADRTGAETMLTMLRKAAGGQSTEVSDFDHTAEEG